MSSGENYPPVAVRVDPPLVVLRVHIGDVPERPARALPQAPRAQRARARPRELRHRRRRASSCRAPSSSRTSTTTSSRRRSTRSTWPSPSRFRPRRALQASSKNQPLPKVKGPTTMGIFSRLAQLIKSQPQRPHQPLGRPREDAEPGRPGHEQPAHRGEEAGRRVDRRREAPRQAARAGDAPTRPSGSGAR